MSISNCGPRYAPPKGAGRVIMVFCNKDKTEAEYSWNREVISGVYYAKGEFGGRYIYEKSVEDPNKMWWSLRFESENNRWSTDSPPKVRRWIFEYSSSKIIMGEEKFGAIIENFSDEPGEFIVKYNSSNFISFYYRRLQTKRESYPTQTRTRTRLLI